jgi:long-chain acyl-CoA synthetase
VTAPVTANVAELLAAAAQRVGESVAVVEPATRRAVTWRELDDAATRVANGLGGLGAIAGNRVVLAVGNRIEFVTTYFALLRAQLVAVPVNPRAKTGELARMVADSGARLVVADPTTVTAARSAAAGLEDALEGADEELRARARVPHVVVLDAPAVPGETSYADLAAATPTPLPRATDAEKLAVLLYTSGTSTPPRAAMLSHRALLANVEQAAAVEPPMMRPDDVVLGVLPLHHVYGLNAVLGQVARRGARLVLLDGFDVEGSLDVLAQEHVTVVPGAPQVFAAWRGVDDLGQRLAGVRLLLSGAAPIAADLVSEIEARTGLTVHQGYGLTETGPVVTSTLCSKTAKPGSVGSALPGVGLRLRDDAGDEPEGEDPGEIQVSGENLFDGYWPDASEGPVDGWLATRDVGFLDEDGDLFLVDRLDDLVMVSGFNVYPLEVEQVLAEVAGVAEAAVVGEPDPITEETVVAFVRAEPDVDPDLLVARIHAHCAARLARFKRPTTVHVVAALPHTVTGKVSKGRLRATVRRRSLGLAE